MLWENVKYLGIQVDCELFPARFTGVVRDGGKERNIYEKEKGIGKRKVVFQNPGHHSSGYLS